MLLSPYVSAQPPDEVTVRGRICMFHAERIGGAGVLVFRAHSLDEQILRVPARNGTFEFSCSRNQEFSLGIEAPGSRTWIGLTDARKERLSWLADEDLAIEVVPGMRAAILELVSSNGEPLASEPFSVADDGWALPPLEAVAGAKVLAAARIGGMLYVDSPSFGRFAARPRMGQSSLEAWTIAAPSGHGSVQAVWRTAPSLALDLRLVPESAPWPSTAEDLRRRSLSSLAGIPKSSFPRVAEGVWLAIAVEDARVPHWFSRPLARIVVEAGKETSVVLDPPQVTEAMLVEARVAEARARSPESRRTAGSIVRGRIAVPEPAALEGFEVSLRDNSGIDFESLISKRVGGYATVARDGTFEVRASGTISSLSLSPALASDSVPLVDSSSGADSWPVRDGLSITVVPEKPVVVAELVARSGERLRDEPFEVGWMEPFAANSRSVRLLDARVAARGRIAITTQSFGRALAEIRPGAKPTEPWRIVAPAGRGSIRVPWRTPPFEEIEAFLLPVDGAGTVAADLPPLSPTKHERGADSFDHLGAGNWAVFARKSSSALRWSRAELGRIEVKPGALAEILLEPPKLRRITVRLANWSDAPSFARPTALWVRDTPWRIDDGSALVEFEEPWPGTLRLTRLGAPIGEVAAHLDADMRELRIELPKELIDRWR